MTDTGKEILQTIIDDPDDIAARLAGGERAGEQGASELYAVGLMWNLVALAGINETMQGGL